MLNKAFASLLILSVVAAPLRAADPLAEFPQRVRKITLKNGMRALIVERPDSPTVSFVGIIRTGGIDDQNGASGLAHMFEHMLFKGTKTVGTKDYAKEATLLNRMDEVMVRLQLELDKRDKSDPQKGAALRTEFEALEKKHAELLIEEEFWQIYERAGGQDFNASTGCDFTDYVISLPKNRVNLWMAMERDRILNPVLREFYKERDVVLEERRNRLENSPQGKLWAELLAAAFVAHPYGRPILGWESDISRVTRPDAQAFFRKHYDISRLVVAIVGGINADDIERELRKNFESIPARASSTPDRIPVEPVQAGERRVTVVHDAEPSVLIGYHRPDMTHPDSAVLEVVANLLGSGRTSRFYLSLIEKKRIAVSAWAGSSAPGERDPHLFVLGSTPRAPHSAADVETALYAEIDRLKKEGPTVRELERVKNNLEASLIRGLAENAGLADQLAYYEGVAGDWNYLFKLIADIRKITAADVKEAIGKYLLPENRTVATLVRKKS